MDCQIIRTWSLDKNWSSFIITSLFKCSYQSTSNPLRNQKELNEVCSERRFHKSFGGIKTVFFFLSFFFSFVIFCSQVTLRVVSHLLSLVIPFPKRLFCLKQVSVQKVKSLCCTEDFFHVGEDPYLFIGCIELHYPTRKLIFPQN